MLIGRKIKKKKEKKNIRGLCSLLELSSLRGLAGVLRKRLLLSCWKPFGLNFLSVKGLCTSGMEKPASVLSSQRLWKNQLLCRLVSCRPGDLPKSLFFPLLKPQCQAWHTLSCKIIWMGFAAGTPFKEPIIIPCRNKLIMLLR